MNFMALNSREKVQFLIDFYLKNTAFTAVKRNAMTSTLRAGSTV